MESLHKNKTIVLIAALLTASTCLADQITNRPVYLGENIGLHETVFNTTGNLYASDGINVYQPETSAGKSSVYSFIENTYMGVGKKTQLFYYGMEFNYAVLAGIGKSTNIKGHFNQQTGQANTYTVEQSLRMFYAISGILGTRVKFSKNNIVYLRAGWANGRFKSQSSLTEGYLSGYSGSFTKWDSGWILGVGINTFYTNRFAIRTEYNYIGFSSFSKTSSASDWMQGGIATWHYHPHTSIFTVGILYFI